MNKLYDRIAPISLFVCTLLCLPALLFQQNLAFLWIDVLLFVVLSSFKKGRIRVLAPLIILMSIVFFNLLAPMGRVLFTMGGFRITEGALLSALEKSGVLIGMVFLSQYAVSRDLHLPGKLGGFISHMFLFFDRLSAEKTAFRVKSPISSIDERLLAVYEQKEYEEKDAATAKIIHLKGTKQSIFSWTVCIVPIVVVYALLVVSRFLSA